MKAEDLRTKSADELKESLIGLHKEQFNLRFQQASGQLENTARVRQVRRDIARIKTILRVNPQAASQECNGNAASDLARCGGKREGRQDDNRLGRGPRQATE